MRVWIVFRWWPWGEGWDYDVYKTFQEAAWNAAWQSVGSARHGNVITVTEAWLSSTEPGEVVTVGKLPDAAAKLPG